MAGFDNEVVYADNVDFSGGFPVTAQVTADGELLIGSTVAPNIRVGSLVSSNGSIDITVGSGTIDIEANGGAIGQTITGNTGGAISPVAGNWNLVTANSTVKIAGTAGTLTQDFNLTNTVLGSSLPSLTVGTANTGIGSNVLNAVTSGVSNTCAGFGAGDNINTGNENCCFGRNAGGILTGGGQNVCVGLSAGASLTGGSSNVLIGRAAGNSFSASVNNNICIGDQVTGSGAVSNSIRIGGTHTTCFVDGITGVTVAASAPVAVDTNDQLSSLGFGTSGQLLSSNGSGVSPTWKNTSTARTATNLGFTYSASTFTITSSAGTALSSTNFSTVTSASKLAPGTLVNINVTAGVNFVDDSGASTIAGNLFGFAAGDTMAQDMPFFIYACLNDAENSIAFSISRTPAMDLVPALSLIGKTGTANADRSYSHFFLGNPTLDDYDTNPCFMVGSFRMRLTTAGGDWTVQALTSTDGIGRYQERRRFELLAGVKGAAAGSFFELNGGATAPIWDDQFYAYTVLPHDGLCEVYVQLANTDTAGSGAVEGRIITPFCHANYQGMSGNGGFAKFGADILMIQISEDPTSENIRFIQAGDNSTVLYDLDDFPTTSNLTVKALFPILQEA